MTRQLEQLYFHSDPIVKQSANSYLMRFQEDPAAWAVSHELLGDPAPYVQFMGAQTLYLKVKRQCATLPDQAGLIARLFACLRDGSGSLQAQTCIRLALCVSALVVRSLASWWPAALEDVVRFGRDGSLPQSRRLALQMLTSMPEEVLDLPQMAHTKSSPPAQALQAKVSLLVAFVMECLDSGDTEPGGLCEHALQCLLQWTKTLGVPFCEIEALSQRLVRFLSLDVLAESLLELLCECLQNSRMASSIWKVKDWPREAPGKLILANGPEGMCLHALLEQLRVLYPQLEQLCRAGTRGVDAAAERRLAAWARVVVMLCESYTQLLFEEECEHLLRFLGGCFQLSPATAQPLFEFWGQMKEMQREDLLSAGHVRCVLLRLTEPCAVSLLRYVRRDSVFSIGAQEDLSTLRDMAKDVTCDMYCLWRVCDASKADEFVGFLSQNLMQALGRRDAASIEAPLVLLDGAAEVLERPLPVALVEALRMIPTMPDDAGAMAAAAVLLQKCAPHMNAHVEVLPSSLEFLIRALPAIPHTAAESMLELTGYAGHHLAKSLPTFLAAVERIAPEYPVKVDGTLYSAVVCTVRRLPATEAVCSFVSILHGTTQKLFQLEKQVQEGPEGRLCLPHGSLPDVFRLLSRIRSCFRTLEQTPDEPDGPPPVGAAGKGNAAACILAALGPCWPAFARTVEAVLAATPSSAARDGRADGGDHTFSEAALAAVAVRVLRSCIATSKSPELPAVEAAKLVHMLLHLLVAVVRRKPAHLLALSPLADLIPAARPHGLQEDFATALQVICELTIAGLRRGGSFEELTPLFELLLACATHLEEALYGSPWFGQLAQLAARALESSDRELNRAVLQFLLRFAGSSDPRVQQAFVECVPTLAGAVLQHFHKWPAATRKHSSGLFAVLLDGHGPQFHAALLHVWRQPGLPGPHTVLTAEEQEVCARLFGQLRGPRLKAFIWDLAAVGNGSQTPDVLVGYQMPCAPPGRGALEAC